MQASASPSPRSSSGVERALHPRLDLCISHLRAQGFGVEEGQCLRQETMSASASADAPAAESMYLLQRSDIDAVIPPWAASWPARSSTGWNGALADERWTAAGGAVVEQRLL